LNPEVVHVYSLLAKKTKTKNNNLLKIKRILNIKKSAKGGPLFAFSLPAGPLPAWDTRRGEEFSEKGLNFLKYVQ